MKNQSIKRLRISRGKTPPRCHRVGFIRPEYKRTNYLWFTNDVDIILAYNRTLWEHLKSWKERAENVLKIVSKRMGKSSRLAMYPLPQNDILMNCLQAPLLFPFQIKKQRICKFLC